ncbi:DUF3089 domain-containing protein [Kriegella sp. EG-1]|nr:DUF3089 domain-containing protein [Flavobacteriaceae bacterium EG-1]
MKNFLLYMVAFVFLVSCSSDDTSTNPNEVETEEIEEIVENPETEETLEQPSSILDYNTIDNWAFHPEQNINLLQLYNLDIGIVNKDLELDGSIEITNNAKTDTGVDVFFVHPTILDNPPASPEVISLADQPTERINYTIIAQGGLLAKYGRVFAPKYRQCTGYTYLDDTVNKELQASVIMQSYSDIKAAFLNYFENYNNGNKIILAGHSQGAYLLSMLVRDLFDQNENLQSKLVTAALAGMGHVYAKEGEFVGGQFENISLCQQIEECGCIQAWRSYEEGQTYSDTKNTLPMFNEELVKYGVINRTVDISNDWFIMDENYLTENQEYVRYIALSSNVNEDHGYNFVAHDNLYLSRMRRDSNTEIGLNITYSPATSDQRINDLAIEEQSLLFDFWGYHTKDYATYLWPLLEQIDAKLANCN